MGRKVAVHYHEYQDVDSGYTRLPRKQPDVKKQTKAIVKRQ
jgi:hypothetical protein